MSEWFKEHAWKACIRQRIGGSNPFLSAKPITKVMGFFTLRLRHKLACVSRRKVKKKRMRSILLKGFGKREILWEVNESNELTIPGI